MEGDAVWLDGIDETVSPHEELAEVPQLRILEPVTAFAPLCEGVASIAHLLRERGGIGGRVLRDEFYGRLEVIDGRVGPDYFASHLARRFLTSAWVLVRPSAAA